MKTGLSLSALAAKLESQAAARKDYVAPQGKLTAIVHQVAPEKREVALAGFNGDEYAIKPHAHKQLAQALEIPGRYYERMLVEEPELLARNINTWFQRQADERRMIRCLDGEIRAVLSPRYRPLDNFELASAILPKLMNLGVQVMSSDLTETRMYIKVILPDLSDALPEGLVWGSGHNRINEYGDNAGGRLVAALTISNSEVGNGALRVEPSVFTTWCTNLAVMKEAAMKKFHVGRSTGETENWEIFRDETRQADDRAFFLKVADVVDRAFDRKVFESAVESIRKAGADKIESNDIAAVAKQTVELLSLPPKTESSILTYLAQGGDMSRWGLASAVTATANKLDDYEMATELEHAGGAMLSMNQADWRKIARASMPA